LTAVGVGVSQVLPVLTLCLLSDPGSLIILEQPELHLHPATQQLLADFFLACARSGRQLLVETHSDHLVSRIRRRIAEDRSGVVKELATIVFAEQHPAEGTSYRPIEVSDYGSVEDWPEGFFDQAATEAQAILKEAVARRKEARAAGEGVE
jgi:predicted ATPase